jgi:predicted RNA-binding Zn-ribbon protein involved in translation (DUF1610 family)
MVSQYSGVKPLKARITIIPMSQAAPPAPICRSCFGDIPPENNPTLKCPKCGEVNRPTAVVTKVKVQGPPPALTLRPCADCYKEISIHAEFCPHCGSPVNPKKRHGVFFYVFWGVVSLIATVVVLFVVAGLTSGVFSGLHGSIALTQSDKESAKTILSQLKKTKDHVTGTVFLKTNWVSDYDNQMFLYLGVTASRDVFLRLKIQHKGSEALFIREFLLRVGGAVETIDARGEIKSDISGSESWEWFDTRGEGYIGMLLTASVSDKVILRCDGSRGKDDRDLSATEKRSLSDMILVYRYLKEAGAPEAVQ